MGVPRLPVTGVVEKAFHAINAVAWSIKRRRIGQQIELKEFDRIHSQKFLLAPEVISNL